MLNNFKSAIDKFFKNAETALTEVVFNICVGEDYDIVRDTKTKRIERHHVRCLMLERTEQSARTAGAKKKELTLVCRVTDLDKVPSISDFFTIKNVVYNILEVVDDNAIYMSIKGE